MTNEEIEILIRDLEDVKLDLRALTLRWHIIVESFNG